MNVSTDGIATLTQHVSWDDASDLPVEEAQLTAAPNVPPLITRDHPVLLKVHLTSNTQITQLTSQYKYEQ
jgi:hypothetical protein